MTREDTTGIVYSDGELQAGDMTLDIAHLLRDSGPWGQAFPEPLFDGAFDVSSVRVLGERHLKMEVRLAPAAGNSTGNDRVPTCEAIAFRHFDHDDAPVVAKDSRVELAYRLDVNHYNGSQRLQLVVEYLRVIGTVPISP